MQTELILPIIMSITLIISVAMYEIHIHRLCYMLGNSESD